MSPTSYQLLHPAISVVVRVGFEPTKRNAADLQSAPFSHSGTSPLRQEILYCIVCALSTLFCQLFSQLVKLKRRRFCGDIFNGAGERNRTPNLLITRIKIATQYTYIMKKTSKTMVIITANSAKINP